MMVFITFHYRYESSATVVMLVTVITTVNGLFIIISVDVTAFLTFFFCYNSACLTFVYRYNSSLTVFKTFFCYKISVAFCLTFVYCYNSSVMVCLTFVFRYNSSIRVVFHVVTSSLLEA